MFQASTTLFEKKFLLVSCLAACGLRFNGSAALLVVLMETSTLWNQVVLSTLSNPRMILNAWSMSAWWRRSLSVVRPISLSFLVRSRFYRLSGTYYVRHHSILQFLRKPLQPLAPYCFSDLHLWNTVVNCLVCRCERRAEITGQWTKSLFVGIFFTDDCI